MRPSSLVSAVCPFTKSGVRIDEMIRSNKVMIKTQHIFPILLILLDLGAAAVYGGAGDIRKVIYWIAAAVLNITVTF